MLEDSVSQYIDGLKRGDELAAQKIWERFYQRLIVQADRKLKASPRKSMDEEDVVQKAFADFFRQVKQGRFPRLDDRNDLWQILAMLVDRRAKDQIKAQNTQKSGGARVHTESVFFVMESSSAVHGLGQVQDVLPSPALVLEFIEVMEERLAGLRNETHRQVALYKMQGYSNREIAELLQSSERTVERSLQSIRKRWEKVVGVDESGPTEQS
jgi:RNA polymerase sigma factor (sigma-70 family)